MPGIRVHTDIESMMWALEEFFLSMLGVNIAVGEQAAWPGAFPQRLLVIDEFGTFAGMAARIHRRAGQAGPLPALDQRRQIEWQGRQAGHRLVVAVHQPNLRLFGDSDSRGQYGYRLITGAYTASLWRMTFGFAPPIEWDARIKGRGVVGIGEAAEPDPPRPDRLDARRRTPPLRPDRPAAPGLVHRHAARPVDRRPRDRRGPQARRGLPGRCPADVRVPPGQDIPVPAQTRRHVPPDVPPPDTGDRTSAGPARRPGGPASTGPRARTMSPSGAPGRSRGTAPPRRAMRPRRSSSASPPPPATSATTSPTASAAPAPATPSPARARPSDGRPCWTPRALRSWQSKRKIAGNRINDGEP